MAHLLSHLPIVNFTLIWCHVSLDVLCKLKLPFEGFIALVTVETPLPSVHLHVALQLINGCGCEVTVNTLERLFPSVVPPQMHFQILYLSTRILAHCAPVRLFP